MSDTASGAPREGSLEAPVRHPIDWKDPDFYQEKSLFQELERVYDICHGCRRCFNLCQAFPILFDLIDESSSMELDTVDKRDYWQVVDNCYLCDMCYMTKCPYVPPHEWNVDFPHLMLRAKAVRHKKEGNSLRDRLLSSTDALGRTLAIPVLSTVVNTVNRIPAARVVVEKTLGVHHAAVLPQYQTHPLRKRLAQRQVKDQAQADEVTRGRVVLFTTCYGNYNDHRLVEDLIAVYEHNGIPVRITEREQCCGMPKLELGDLEAVESAMQANVPALLEWVEQGWDIVAPIPSCVLMFRQELPLLCAGNESVLKVQDAIYDPFEYLMLRHRAGLLKTDFKQPLGSIAYHAACHQRVQNIGAKTREVLELVPATQVTSIERCSGHDGTYAVKKEFHEASMKIVRPVVRKVVDSKADHYTSDCVMAGHHIQNGMGPQAPAPRGPMSLLRTAYGI